MMTKTKEPGKYYFLLNTFVWLFLLLLGGGGIILFYFFLPAYNLAEPVRYFGF